MDIERFIRDMPKAELHLHIEGTLEPELKFKLGERNGIQLAHRTVEEMRAAYTFNDLSSFLAAYYEGMGVLRTARDFHDLAWAYLTRAQSEHVRYVEMFFDPQAHTSRGVDFESVISGLRSAILDARARLGIESQLIMCFLRDYSAEYAMATLLESLRHRPWIIGVGLDSDERDNPPAKFAEVFKRARTEGYRLTMHCDVDQQDSVGHIRQCVEMIGVARIDHGVNILEDPALCEVVRERRIGLTVCPISNRWVAGDLKAAEVKRMLELELLVTVNSDDPAYFGGYVTDNLIATQKAAGLTPEQMIRLERNAIDISWAPPAVRARLLEELETYEA
jgi:adenosine deaminase